MFKIKLFLGDGIIGDLKLFFHFCIPLLVCFYSKYVFVLYLKHFQKMLFYSVLILKSVT